MEVACPVAPADDWVVRTADQVRAEAERRHPGEPPTVASGISPSGPVHLGNLRELMVPHLIADEVRRQGVDSRDAQGVLYGDGGDRGRGVTPQGGDGLDAAGLTQRRSARLHRACEMQCLPTPGIAGLDELGRSLQQRPDGGAIPFLHGFEEPRLGGRAHSATCPMPPRSAPAAVVSQSTSCPSGSARLLGMESQRR